MLISIRLINWRSHADTKLEFRKGTNLLVGIMGAGKSSILEGISFALFGTFPALERRKLKLENVIRLNEPIARVVLEFAWDGIDYRIERAVERSKKGVRSSAELFRSGSLIENGTNAVTSYIKTLIGVDYDLFTRAIYSEQNNIDYFFTLDPKERKEEMDALLGLDRFELARSNIVYVINKVRTKREELMKMFSKDKLSELEAKEKTHNEEKNSLEESLKQTSLSYEKASKDLASISSGFEEMRKSRERFLALSKEEIRLSALFDSLKKETQGKSVDEEALKALEKKLQSSLEERTKLAQSQKALEEKNSKFSKDAGAIESHIKSATDSKIRLEASESELVKILLGMTPDDLNKKQKASEQAMLFLESERKSYEREISDTEQSLSKLKPGLSECPLCFSKLTDDGILHVREEKDSLIKKKKERISAIASEFAEKKKENDDLIARIRRASILNEKISTLNKELESAIDLPQKKTLLEAELARLAQERKDLQSKLDAISEALDSQREELSKKKALAEKTKEAQMTEKKLQEAKSQLAEMRFDEKTFDDLRSSAERIRLECERLASSKRSADIQLKMIKDMLDLMRSELASLRGMENDMKSFYELEDQLSLYKNALLETQTSLRLSLADAINTAMNEIWGIFYPYKNYRALRLGVSEKDYVFEVDDGSGWKGLETIASGGERACAALALRVSLAMVLTPKLGWLILDEPTHNLDSEAVAMLSSALEFKVPEVVNQTFVITHDEAFMGSEFASSYRLKRDKERNGETKVEAM